MVLARVQYSAGLPNVEIRFHELDGFSRYILTHTDSFTHHGLPVGSLQTCQVQIMSKLPLQVMEEEGSASSSSATSERPRDKEERRMKKSSSISQSPDGNAPESRGKLACCIHEEPMRHPDHLKL